MQHQLWPGCHWALAAHVQMGNEMQSSSSPLVLGPPGPDRRECGSEAPEAGLFLQQDRAEPPSHGRNIEHLGVVLCCSPSKFCHDASSSPIHGSSHEWVHHISCDSTK